MSKELTLSQLQQSIKSALGERFPLPVWVCAEISEIKVNYSGHCYLELVEKGEGDKLPRAQSKAVIWRNNYTALSSYFTSQTGQELTSGLKVLVKVLVNFHELYGMSLQITDIDPAYTVGDTEQQRQRTIAQLQKDGVWDMNRGVTTPRFIQRIAIVSSANAAGYQDFEQEIARSGYHFEMTLFDAFMQGDGAEDSIIRSLEAIATSDEEFDVVVVIRGGGSKSDLRCFDSYRLASHVAQFPLAIFSGIGHDKDTSVVDMVSHTSLKTPTAVATLLVERMSILEGWLDASALALHDGAQRITRSHELKLEGYQTQIEAYYQQLLTTKNRELELYTEQLTQIANQLLTLEKSRLEGLSATVELHSPDHLLRLGYAVARMGEKALRGDELTEGDKITIRLSKAEIEATVDNIINYGV